MAGKGRIENLRPPWKPGESGNPGGRPKKRPISDRYEACAEEPLPDDLRRIMKLRKGATWGDAVAISQYRAAVKGKPDAAREIREAIEGKATLRLEVSSELSVLADITERMRKARKRVEEHPKSAPLG